MQMIETGIPNIRRYNLSRILICVGIFYKLDGNSNTSLFVEASSEIGVFAQHLTDRRCKTNVGSKINNKRQEGRFLQCVPEDQTGLSEQIAIDFSGEVDQDIHYSILEVCIE